jgi:hypothetical protein
MTSLDCRPMPQVVYPQSVETIPFQEFDVTASASLSWPPAPPPQGEVLQLVVAGRVLMAADQAELGEVDEQARDEVRQQWPD